MHPHALRESLQVHRAAMLERLRQWVEHESPSRDKPALDALAARIAEMLRERGGEVIEIENGDGGNHVQARFPGATEAAPALVLGHFDTVWPMGTLATMPYRVEAGRAFGPGTFDMKASLVLVEFALRVLAEEGARPSRPLIVLFTSDEEIGSPTSRSIIETVARDAAYALVMESPLPGGRLKTARKGVGGFTLEVTGRPAHAGVEPEKGASAVMELARQVIAIAGLVASDRGTTVNVGVVQGGTAPNVVPAFASARIDVRVTTMEEAHRIEVALHALEPLTPGTTLRVSGGFNRPPMERTEGITALFERARELALPLGLELTEGATGGGSDANFTAALGVPTLDGLGTEGEGAHANHEHIRLDSLPERAALLATLLARM